MNLSTYQTLLGIVLIGILSENHQSCCNSINENEISYSYRYSINTNGVVMQHWEEGLADLVHGSYSFMEPTGKIRVVHYQVTGKNGFRAVVSFRNPPSFPSVIGHLQYPDYYTTPIILEQPVGLITNDLLHGRNSYPNFP